MANLTRTTLAAVVGRAAENAELTRKLRRATGKTGSRIAWNTIDAWVRQGFLVRERDDALRTVRYFVTTRGVAAAEEARARARETAARVRDREKRAEAARARKRRRRK